MFRFIVCFSFIKLHKNITFKSNDNNNNNNNNNNNVGNGVEPTPHSLKKCQHCHVILLHQKIERTRMYDHEDEKVVFEEEYKLNKTIPACGVSFILLLRLHKNLAVTITMKDKIWRPIVGVTNGLCEHSRACRALRFFCEHEQK